MELKRILLEQLEREAAASRKVVERVPEGKNSWKPHARSMELGMLAALVAGQPGWPWMMIDFDELDLTSPSTERFRTKPMETRLELMRALEEGLSRSRKALEKTTEEHLQTRWRLRMGDTLLSDRPRYEAILDGALSHASHHRGQLTVYLRMLEEKVPAIFGPSADEGPGR